MRTIDEIKKQILGIDAFITGYKKSLDFYLNDDFDIDKAIKYSNKIKSLQSEKDILEWVLNESI